jgi:hypothetical protein
MLCHAMPKVDNREQHFKRVTAANFYTMFELRTHLPGNSVLRVSCVDHDGFGRASDDLIGSTELDLEDRVFCKRWKDELSERPVASPDPSPPSPPPPRAAPAQLRGGQPQRRVLTA